MSVELLSEIQPVADAPVIRDGWRGLLDFGEVWTESDAVLWPSEEPLPLGKPLTYGCEVRRDPASEHAARIRLLVVTEPREVMKKGATFTLRDGHTARATGKLL